MNKTAYILHGVCDKEEYFTLDFPSPSNAHWLPWLQQQFLRQGTLCQCLEMPKPYAPAYPEWAQVWAQATLTSASVVVGHSAGAGFILKWLSAHPQVRLAKLVLVAPWLDPQGSRGDFLTTILDPALQNRVAELHVFYAQNEEVAGVSATKDLLLQTYPRTQLHTFATHGHFCLSDLGTPAFPELWQVCQAS